tara:strand:+ start:4444 stop:5274 length:831 start_codon:yes stop_codon:yes gene_type:complete
MAQATDFTIANQSFPDFRTDLNTVLGAINSNNSGTSRPSSATTGTIWLDTTNAGSNSLSLKFFDGSDDITLATIDTSANTVNFIDSAVASDLVNDTTPQLGGQLDVNGNALGDGTLELLKFSETASAVNEFTIANAATGNNPVLSATGGDTNVGLEFTAKGSGYIKFNDLAYIPQQALTSSSNAVAWDVQAKPNAYHLTTENTTFAAPTNSVEGSFICLEINYNGSHTIAFNTVFEFAASTAPTFTSTDGKTDILVFRYNGAVWQEVGRTLNLSES